eukprot:5300375-Pyramimonas_sp.AAC.1
MFLASAVASTPMLLLAATCSMTSLQFSTSALTAAIPPSARRGDGRLAVIRAEPRHLTKAQKGCRGG